jgi:aminoglycoside 3-N-acetyltransferase
MPEKSRSAAATAKRVLLSLLPQRVDSSLRHVIAARARGKSAAVHRRSARAVSRAELAADLEALPVEDGQIVFFHSGLKSLGYVEGGAEAVVDLLIWRVVAKDGGTLAMPAFSMKGTMEGTLRADTVFDVKETPSTVGAVTEAFRKRSGVVRSLHPTHSVAAIGPRAEWLTKSHHTDPHPFGVASPLGKLVAEKGLYAGLGVDLRPFTLVHVLEDLEADFPHRVYTKDSPLSAQVRDAAGRLRYVFSMAHDRGAFEIRIDSPAADELRAFYDEWFQRKANLVWLKAGVGRMWAMRADACYDAMVSLMHKGVTHYSPPSDPRFRELADSALRRGE